ncbi:MAG: DUF1778 domain-containing protein [Propionibacteriaceae bacterium]|nr:DUF1778 domain-containing protein [Propionibacteriaceae bacterium]
MPHLSGAPDHVGLLEHVHSPYDRDMAQPLRQRRFETRLDAQTDNLISEAADLLGVSRSAFVVRASRQAAEKVVAPGAMTRQQAIEVLLEDCDESLIESCPLMRALTSAS